MAKAVEDWSLTEQRFCRCNRSENNSGYNFLVNLKSVLFSCGDLLPVSIDDDASMVVKSEDEGEYYKLTTTFVISTPFRNFV